MRKNETKSLTAKDVVIVRSATGEVERNYGRDITLGEALRAYADEIGADKASIKQTGFGMRLTVSGEGDFRATYR